MRPSFHVIFFDNFVNDFPGAFSEQQKEGDEDDKEESQSERLRFLLPRLSDQKTQLTLMKKSIGIIKRV